MDPRLEAIVDGWDRLPEKAKAHLAAAAELLTANEQQHSAMPDGHERTGSGAARYRKAVGRRKTRLA
jgi:hypothetical protein